MVRSITDTHPFPLPDLLSDRPRDLLTEILRGGAQRMLAQVVHDGVTTCLAERVDLVDDRGHQRVVRNGYLPQRTVTTGIGPIPVKQPRVRDRRSADQRETFTSAILPRYLRRTKSVEELLPWLYLKGISTGDFGEALQALLGKDAKGLSATTITRLKAICEKEYEAWSKRSLASTHYVYVWADGVYFNVRLEDEANSRQCILILMGATAEGEKELIAIMDGYHESYQSWKELLLDCKDRGLGPMRRGSEAGDRGRGFGFLGGDA